MQLATALSVMDSRRNIRCQMTPMKLFRRALCLAAIALTAAACNDESTTPGTGGPADGPINTNPADAAPPGTPHAKPPGTPDAAPPGTPDAKPVPDAKPAALHNCTTYTPRTGAVTIQFGVGGNVYSPRCIQITKGTVVTFSG